MRVFQFEVAYASYLAAFDRTINVSEFSYRERLELLLRDRFDAVHILEPALQRRDGAKFTVANDAKLQVAWAREHGLRTEDLDRILLAQIEDHRAEVVYCMDPTRYGQAFVQSLPGCVKKTVCWFAAPEIATDLSDYDVRLSNDPSLLEKWTRQGLRAVYFCPAYDPEMEPFAQREDRPVDLAFVGQYSLAHARRNELLAKMSRLHPKYNVTFALMSPRFARLGKAAPWNRVPLPWPFLPTAIRAVAAPPRFGRAVYELFSRSKIVVNAAVDYCGPYRGNMRCFEALGCGACMLSDDGIYPPGMKANEHFSVYHNAEDALEIAVDLLRDTGKRIAIARAGHEMVRTTYSKSRQWEQFVGIVNA